MRGPRRVVVAELERSSGLVESGPGPRRFPTMVAISDHVITALTTSRRWATNSKELDIADIHGTARCHLTIRAATAFGFSINAADFDG